MFLRIIGIAVLLLVVLPPVIGLSIRWLKKLSGQAKAGKITAIWGLALLIIACLAIVIWDEDSIIFIVPLMISAVVILIANLKRKIWYNRIHKHLDGELGQKLKRIIPYNAEAYAVYSNRIAYRAYTTVKQLTFQDVGFKNIPEDYTNIVCMWIRDNMTTGKAYQISAIYRTVKEYVPGEPDTYKIEKTYSGDYTVAKQPGSISYYNYKDVLDGYKMETQEAIDAKNEARKKSKLSKW